MYTETTGLHQLEQAIFCSVARGHGPQHAVGIEERVARAS